MPTPFIGPIKPTSPAPSYGLPGFGGRFNDGSGFDDQGNNVAAPTAPVVPTPIVPTPDPFPRSVPTTPDPYSDIEKSSRAALLRTATPVQTEDQIRQDKLRNSQGIIDAINLQFGNALAVESGNAQRRDTDVRQSMLAQGLAGSSEAPKAAGKVTDGNDQIRASIEAQKSLQIQQIFSDVNKDAETELRRQEAEFKAQAEGNLVMVDKLRKDKVAQTNASVTRFSELAKLSGNNPTTWDDIKKSNPDVAESWKKSTGKDDLELGMLFNQAKQANQKITWNNQISHYDEKRGVMIMIGTKADGSTVIQEQPTKTPIPSGNKPQMFGDQMFLVDDRGVQIDADGKVTGITRYGSLGQFKNESAKIVKIDGVDYQLNADGSYTKPSLPISAESNDKALNQITLIKSSLKKAEDLSGASGRSGARRTAEAWLVGSTDYTNLVAETNTVRTNVLTMMTDPSIKKFFGPQMSNADVQLMTSAGTTLNPELQSPEKMKEEITRLNDLVNRAEKAVKDGGASISKPGNMIEYNGKQYQVDEQGNFDPNSPLTSVGSGTNNAQGGQAMRTDRHNNPSAFTTDIAKMAGLQEGVDYTKGDPFSNGRYSTARLLNDPIATTIKVIDKIGFKTASGGNRWTYTDSIPETKNWSRLSYDQKKDVISKMYQHEGGSQLNRYFA